MGTYEIIEGIEYGIKLITLLVNSTGAQDAVSAIIAKRIAEGGRDWTDAERQTITDAVTASKAYAEAELDKPDA